MSFTIDETITQELKKLESESKDSSSEALYEARDYICESLYQNIPANKNTSKLKDDITYSDIGTNGTISIGFGKNTYLKASAVELGTIRQPGAHFMSNTIYQSQGGYKNIIESVLKKELGI